MQLMHQMTQILRPRLCPQRAEMTCHQRVPMQPLLHAEYMRPFPLALGLYA